MNCNQILDLFEYIDDRYVLEAVASRGSDGRKKLPRRWIVLAAVIAATMLLVGCTAVYLWMNGLAFTIFTIPKYHNDEGEALPVPGVEVRWVSSMVGFGDSPISLALQEWYYYTKDYVIDDPLFDDDLGHPDVPVQYRANYSCNTPEMVEKLDSIAEKYNLQLLDTYIAADGYKLTTALEEMGLDALIKNENYAKFNNGTILMYPPYDLEIETYMQLACIPATTEVLASVYYHHKAYMPPYRYWIANPDDYTQWQYTASDGTPVYMAYSDGSGIMMAEQPEGFLMLNFSFMPMGTTTFTPNQATMEQLAEYFDFTVMPRAVEPLSMQAALDASVNERRAMFELPVELRNAFGVYLKGAVTQRPELRDWTFGIRDITGDGKQELLLGQEGEVLEVISTDSGGALVEITVEEADTRHLYWQPVLRYMNAEGKYIGCQMLEVDGVIPNDRLPLAYAAEFLDDSTPVYTHYRILDINRDGTDDILLSTGGECYHTIWSYEYGTVWQAFFKPFYLCENGVIEHSQQIQPYQANMLDYREYYQLTDNWNAMEQDFLEYVAYDRFDDIWYGVGKIDFKNVWTEITAEEANDIIAKYPRIDQGMRPIEELLSLNERS